MPSLNYAFSSPLRVSNGGLFRSRGVGMHPERVIDTHELIFVREGTLDLYEEETLFSIDAGQTLILWPGRRHGWALPYPPDLQFYWLHFEMRDGVAASFESGVPQHAVVRRPDHLTELFRRFLDDQESGISEETGDLLVLLMLQELRISAAETTAEGRTGALLAQRADAHIRAHFHQPLRAGLIAEALGSNPDYLNRVFHRATGQTLTEAIHRTRIRHARRLLLEGDRNIDEVARASGFEEAAYFRQLFKRYEGMTPFAYRRLYAKMHVNTQ